MHAIQVAGEPAHCGNTGQGLQDISGRFDKVTEQRQGKPQGAGYEEDRPGPSPSIEAEPAHVHRFDAAALSICFGFGRDQKQELELFRRISQLDRYITDQDDVADLDAGRLGHQTCVDPELCTTAEMDLESAAISVRDMCVIEEDPMVSDHDGTICRTPDR